MSDANHGGKVFEAARTLGVQPEEILDFSASINPLGPAPGVREALVSSFDLVGHYPDRNMAELRAAIARSRAVPADCITPGNGSTELIWLIPRLADPGRAAILSPAFSEYGAALASYGIPCDHLILSPEQRFGLSCDQLRRELDTGYGLLFLANPGNPTGRRYSRSEVAAVAAICRAAGTFLVVDEAFVDFCEEDSITDLAANDDRLLVLRSMTKFFGIPGLRLGYAVASPGTSRRLRALQPPWSVSTPAQVAGVASLADAAYAARTLRYVAEQREKLLAGLAGIPGLHPFPSAANYLLVENRGPVPTAELANRLLRQERILVRTCADFPGLDDRFFRVAVRSAGENDRLLFALDRLCRSAGTVRR